jgi:hypothetical protein
MLPPAKQTRLSSQRRKGRKETQKKHVLVTLCALCVLSEHSERAVASDIEIISHELRIFPEQTP